LGARESRDGRPGNEMDGHKRAWLFSSPVEERMIDQRRVKTAGEEENIELEIQALAASRSETEGKYLVTQEVIVPPRR
jgi:hypothetical protein